MKATTYKDLVNCYASGCKLRFNCNLKFHSTIHEFTYGYKTRQQNNDGIACCVQAYNPKDLSPGKVPHWHQRRIPDKVLSAFESNMISASPFPKFTNFEDLFDYVASKSGLSRKGRLLLSYDFCLRYGDSLGIRPKDYVYLFNGAHTGAENLFNCPVCDYKLPYSLFVPYLGNSLDAAEVEDFLCVCKDHILYITTHFPHSVPVLPTSGISSSSISSLTTKP